MKTNNLFKISLLVLPLLIGCGTKVQGSSPTEPSNSEEPKPEEISVVVLAGQSNMEGNTLSQYIDPRYGFSEEEVERIRDGYKDIKMSYRCFWNGAPNAGTNSYGMFESIRLGQANSSSKFGPEIGIADYLTEQGYGEDVVFIKYAVGASVLAPNAGEWGSPTSRRVGKWYEAMTELVASGLETLEERTGKKPVIKAMCWMQGESDAGNTTYNRNYFSNTMNFVNDLRDEWSEYSKEGGFTFIDAYISQYWSGYKGINGAKLEFNDFDDNSLLIDTISEGLEYDKQPVGSVDYYHYDSYSMYKLGRLFGEQIKEAL